MVTATGWTFDAINESSFCDILELLEYWAEEPPAHVLLAMRYLGESKRRKPKQSEEEFRAQMGGVAGMLGQQPQKLPDYLKDMIRGAEQMKEAYKGL